MDLRIAARGRAMNSMSSNSSPRSARAAGRSASASGVTPSAWNTVLSARRFMTFMPGPIAQHPLGGRIGQHDLAVGVDDQHRFRHAAEGAFHHRGGMPQFLMGGDQMFGALGDRGLQRLRWSRWWREANPQVRGGSGRLSRIRTPASSRISATPQRSTTSRMPPGQPDSADCRVSTRPLLGLYLVEIGADGLAHPRASATIFPAEMPALSLELRKRINSSLMASRRSTSWPLSPAAGGSARDFVAVAGSSSAKAGAIASRCPAEFGGKAVVAGQRKAARRALGASHQHFQVGEVFQRAYGVIERIRVGAPLLFPAGSTCR